MSVQEILRKSNGRLRARKRLCGSYHRTSDRITSCLYNGLYAAHGYHGDRDGTVGGTPLGKPVHGWSRVSHGHHYVVHNVVFVNMLRLYIRETTNVDNDVRRTPGCGHVTLAVPQRRGKCGTRALGIRGRGSTRARSAGFALNCGVLWFTSNALYVVLGVWSETKLPMTKYGSL
jgi:hypothetical protein